MSLHLAHCSVSRRCKNSFGYWRMSGLPYLATSTAEPDPNRPNLGSHAALRCHDRFRILIPDVTGIPETGREAASEALAFSHGPQQRGDLDCREI